MSSVRKYDRGTLERTPPCLELEYSASSNLAARKGLRVRLPPVARMDSDGTPQPTRRFVVHCKKEPFDVYIGRPGPWGNPFSDKPKSIAEVKVETREEAIACYEEMVRQDPQMIERIKKELKGKVLGCWCAPKACHGEVLARIANE